MKLIENMHKDTLLRGVAAFLLTVAIILSMMTLFKTASLLYVAAFIVQQLRIEKATEKTTAAKLQLKCYKNFVYKQLCKHIKESNHDKTNAIQQKGFHTA